jgi:hypothetical protein
MANMMANTVHGASAEPLQPPQEPSYGRAALWDQHNVIAMIGALAFSLAFASPLPVAVGLLAELIWLTVAPRHSSFRAWVDRGLRRERQARENEALLKLQGELPPSHSGRFAAFGQLCEELQSLVHGTLDAAPREVAENAVFRLRWAFLEYQLLDARLMRNSSAAPRPALEREIEQITLGLQGEKDWGRRVAGNRALMLAKGRAQQLAELEAIQRTCELRLDSFEKWIGHLKTQAETPEGSLMLAPNIDALLSQFGTPKALEAALSLALATLNRVEA